MIEKAVAEKLGYHPSPGMTGSRDVVEQRQERDKSLSAEAFKLVYDEKGGCGKKAGDYLVRNGGKANNELFRRLNAEILEEARKQPDVEKASRAWSSCMAERGFRYRAPVDAMADQQWWSDDSERASSARPQLMSIAKTTAA
ncbi:hypothetical protein [Streptomyces sp. NPDC017260]|uniref:hypothetical protein n=1 Tax=unclassified Streptomyces TaxID=2593676 RepID=UPI003791D603